MESENMNQTDKKNSIVILTGPTAVGKTELSIELAKRYDGEIVSADSIQVYKHFDIGSAKITEAEMQGVRHHLIDVLEPDQSFSVAAFKDMAKAAVTDILSRGKLPIVVGGTGFYIQALLYDIDFKENEDDGYREKLQGIYDEKGAGALYEMLKACDPVSFDTMDLKNIKRVIRALEYYHQTGECISKHNETERKKESPYNFAYFVLNCSREKLYGRIDKRVDMMINDGLVDEVKQLISSYKLTRDMVSMQGLGYKEIAAYLDGEISLDEAVYILKRDTRHFAKRQLTWFKRERDVCWLDKDVYTGKSEQMDYIAAELKKRKIID
jgi:tRNA dimethylallyltransferase